jgi:exodeoxyribonuclease-3
VVTTLRIATANVNGIRAAYRRGMGDWLTGRGIDILALQEVRAETEDLVALLGEDWDVVHDAASAKGRAGVAIASRHKAVAIHRVAIGAEDFDSAGRWLEADYEVGGTPLTVVSAYVHSGEDGTPKQAEKYKLLDGMTERMAELGEHRTVVLGDLNVGHRELDIKNWKGNVKRAGFLPEERAYFDRWLETGWVDVGRQSAGEVPGPYTWWSWRGKSFDLDSGWRIDYQLASPMLAPAATSYSVDRAPTYAERWSDHAPVVVDYAL